LMYFKYYLNDIIVWFHAYVLFVDIPFFCFFGFFLLLLKY